jgi:hypothetical protein
MYLPLSPLTSPLQGQLTLPLPLSPRPLQAQPRDPPSMLTTACKYADKKNGNISYSLKVTRCALKLMLNIRRSPHCLRFFKLAVNEGEICLFKIIYYSSMQNAKVSKNRFLHVLSIFFFVLPPLSLFLSWLVPVIFLSLFVCLLPSSPVLFCQYFPFLFFSDFVEFDTFVKGLLHMKVFYLCLDRQWVTRLPAAELYSYWTAAIM